MPRRVRCYLLALSIFLATSALIAQPQAAQPQATRSQTDERAAVSAQLNASALRPGDQGVVAVVLDVAEGYHAQSHATTGEGLIPLEVGSEPHPAVRWAQPVYPAGEDVEYELLGPMSVYTGRAITYLPLRIAENAAAGELILRGTVRYQICDDKACFLPQTQPFEVKTKVVAAGEPVELASGGVFAGYTPSAAASAEAAPATRPALVAATVAGGPDWSIPAALGAALLAGLLFNVMPCVLPVLPLKAAAFHRAAEHDRGRSILLGTAFSVGIVSVFAILALLVLVLRVVSWGGLFASPWFVWSIVVLLVVCAAGLFGAFTLQLPGALYSVDPRQDTIGGNVVFGAFTAILATPCTAPLLPPLLLWASSKPAVVGVPAMLAVGVGMALPYLFLSATPELAKRFPRTGPWAELFKQMMGFMLLAAAAYFGGGRIIHGPAFWWAVVAVIAVASFYLMARTVQLTTGARPVAICSTLAVAMLGGSIWWTAGINGLLAKPVALTGATAGWQDYSDEAFEAARAQNKLVLIKFTANWCATCQYIEGTVYQDARVWQALSEHGVVTLKADLTESNAPGQPHLLRLNPAGGIPLTAIYSPNAQAPIVLASVYSSSDLLDALKQAGGTVAAAR